MIDNEHLVFFRQNSARIKEILFRKDVKVFFVASPFLRSLLVKGDDPMIAGLAAAFKAPLIEGKGLLIQKRMVLDYIEGTLNEKNTFILNHGDIRILDDGFNLKNIQ
ncbi:MAG: hypothetical protein WDA06_06535 [Phenylobacterium sp.]